MAVQSAYVSLFICLLLFITCQARSLQNNNENNGMAYKYNGDVGEAANEEDLEAQFVEPQNAARAKVGDPPLVWDAKVASYAKQYASERRGDCALQHSNGPYGENIFWGSGSAWQAKDAVAAWIGEDVDFNYHTHSCNGYEKCGHYTQIVWKHSLRVGCAKVICNSGDTFITCNYDPPGNYIGQKPY